MTLNRPLAAFLAARHDGRVQSVPKIVRQVIEFVRAVDFNRLARGVEDHFAMSALVQVLFQLGSRFSGDRVVDQVVEKGDELSAGHLVAPKLSIFLAQGLISQAPSLSTLVFCGSSGSNARAVAAVRAAAAI